MRGLILASVSEWFVHSLGLRFWGLIVACQADGAVADSWTFSSHCSALTEPLVHTYPIICLQAWLWARIRGTSISLATAVVGVRTLKMGLAVYHGSGTTHTQPPGILPSSQGP